MLRFLLFWFCTCAYLPTQAQPIDVAHHGTTGLQLARQGAFEQAIRFWEPVLDFPEKLHGYGFGVWFSQALRGDSLAEAFFKQELGSDAWQKHTATLQLYFRLRSSKLSQTEHFKLTESCLQKESTDCYWQPFYRALLAFDYARLFPTDTLGIVRLYKQQLLAIAPCTEASPSNPAYLQYLQAVYAHHLAALQQPVDEVAPFQISAADYQVLHAFLLHPGFKPLESLLTDFDTLTNQQLVDFQFNLPLKEQLLKGLQEKYASGLLSKTAYVELLTSSWPDWPHDSLINDLPAIGQGWILLDFWGTWCRPCREELPGLQELHAYNERLSASQLEIRTYLNNSPKWRAFMATHQYSFHARPLDPPVFDALQVNSFPTTLLIAPNGKYQCIDPLHVRLSWLQWLAELE